MELSIQFRKLLNFFKKIFEWYLLNMIGQISYDQVMIEIELFLIRKFREIPYIIREELKKNLLFWNYFPSEIWDYNEILVPLSFVKWIPRFVPSCNFKPNRFVPCDCINTLNIFFSFSLFS